MRILLPLLAAVLVLSGCSDSGTKDAQTKLEKKAARIHAAAYTVDSHTDTPLRLNRMGFDFGVRNDPRETGSK
ncbi:MAG: membrane dipeptidase, partial [Bacteroidota bacterium]|nr:membrane dipeptidase [Bacteroidota bacterium]